MNEEAQKVENSPQSFEKEEDCSPVFSKPFVLIRSKSELFENHNFETHFLSEKILNLSEEKDFLQEKNIENFTVVVDKMNLLELELIEEFYEEKVDFLEFKGTEGKFAKIVDMININPHQSTSILINPNQSPSIPFDPHQPPSIPINIHKSPSIHINTQEMTAIQSSPDQSPSILIDTSEPPYLPINIHKPTSIPINPLQPTSIPINPHQSDQEKKFQENNEEDLKKTSEVFLEKFQKNQQINNEELIEVIEKSHEKNQMNITEDEEKVHENQQINNEKKINEFSEKPQENRLETSDVTMEKAPEIRKEILLEQELLQESTIILQKTQDKTHDNFEIIEKTPEILNEIPFVKTQENTEILQEKPQEIIQETTEKLQEKSQENLEILHENSEILQENTEILQEKPEIPQEKPQEILQETPEIYQEIHESSEESSLQNLSKYDSERLRSPLLEGLFANNSPLIPPQKISFENESLEDFNTQKASFFSKLETIKNAEEIDENSRTITEECDFSEENERKEVNEPRTFLVESNKTQENIKETEEKSKENEFLYEKKCEILEKVLKEGFLYKKSRNFLSGWQVFFYL